ncbi:DUF3347 domain-containing protein [Marixanthomonas ophiurae]|uniref:DUF3347 domain-containing protein n=1 Tax=Marixanthomonas ophiurae TaxID=387659 RepID=A0A3E1QC42_9FLAO|nr:DUF3347 domain-containing protein [Marixanthomonas ophiurae]RFN59666.1 DUF3347 domain-containing protein [Marixanthomonas ophiurae]
MKKHIFLSVLLVVITLVSCADNKKKTEPEIKTVDTKAESKTYVAAKTDAEFKDEKTAGVFKQYVKLKTALVNTNAEKASQEASNLMTSFANVGVDNVALQAAQNIVESNDIKEQRTAFVAVTTEVEKMMEDALSSGTIYKQYCPMAFNNKGAFWLSESKDIMNPYFGDKMLKCGRVDAEIQ